MNPRIFKVREILEQKNLDGLLVTKPVNVAYLLDYPIADSYLLITPKKNIIFTDFRYFTEARCIKGVILRKISRFVGEEIASSINELKLERVGFEGDAISYAFYLEIKKRLRRSTFIRTKTFVEYLRMVKDKKELLKIRNAVKVAKDTHSYIKKIVRKGSGEAEIARKIDIFMRSRGADAVAFPTIVASGPNSALPHALTTQRKIKNGEPVMVDFGARLTGYNSDLTRMFCLGKMNAVFNKIYSITRYAQELAISYIKPGVKISEVDLAARNFIASRGYGRYFGHSLGHGIGLEIHELPRIYKTVETRLMPDMVFTVEPAIYIPGRGGVRVEDMVLVTEKGCEVLTDDIDKSI